MLWIDEQVVEVFSGKEEFWTKMDDVRTQLDEMSKNVHALQVLNARIFDQVARVAESGGFDPCLLLH